MEYEIEVGGRTAAGGRHADGIGADGVDRRPAVDASNPARIDAQTLSLLIGHAQLRGDARSLDAATGQLIVPASDRRPIAVTPERAPPLGRRTRRAAAAGRSGSWRRCQARSSASWCKPGDAVRARQPLVVVEAMKMENELRAARDGTVAEVHAREGSSVEAGALLAVLT